MSDAYKLKDFFDRALIAGIAADLCGVHSSIDQASFVEQAMQGLEQLELTGRAWQVAQTMHDHLPSEFTAASAIVAASLGPALERTDSFGLAPLRYMPHVFFVHKYGIDDFEAAMGLQYELTKRFSAEFSIRRFIESFPDTTLDRLRA